MLITRISGHLGQQIAQFAIGKYYAAALNQSIRFELPQGLNHGSANLPLRHWIDDGQAATAEELARARTAEVFSSPTQFERAWQEDSQLDAQLDFRTVTDFRAWEDRANQLRLGIPSAWASAAVNQELALSIANSQSLAIHLKAPLAPEAGLSGGLTSQYFQDALAHVSNAVSGLHAFVFTDHLDWARSFLNLQFPHTFVATDQLNENLNTFQFMRLCKHHIGSDHEVSILSALLAEQPGIVVVPQVLLADDAESAPGRTAYRWPRSWYPMPLRQRHEERDLRHIAGGHAAHKPIRIGVWNFYEEITTDGFLFKNSNVSIGHNLLKPWCDLYRYGQSNGLQFVTMDQTSGPDDVDAILFMDRPSPRNPMVQKLLTANIRKYLCIYETEVIKPDNWDLEYHKSFDRVFTWSDAHVDGKRYIKMNYSFEPVPYLNLESLSAVFDQRKFCTLIAGAKKSNHKHELYSARVNAIQWFQENAPSDFEFFGVGWNPAEFPSYRGRVQNKLATLSQYKFCICYENATGYDGYMTEKLFDCFLAGTVPIYWGAPNITDWVPADCFVDQRRFASMSQLHEFLKGMDEATYARYLTRIQDFLDSKKAYPFSNEAFVTTITGYIAKDVKTSRAEVPDVTVIIPNYNYGKYLDQAISSVLNQTNVDVEVIVVDNASTDDSMDVVAPFRSDPRFRFLRNLANIGAPLNWKNGLRIASGRYVAVLSADDFFLPGHLQRMVDRMNQDQDLALCYCPILQVDEESQPIELLRHPGHPPHDYFGARNDVGDLLAFDCYITPSAALIRRSSLESVGEINTSLQGAIDWELWIRIAETSGRFGFFKESMVCYRVHPQQDTTRLNSNAGLLEDHVAILWGVLLRGHFSALKENAKQILGILYGKYLSFPEHLVSHLIPQINALRGLLLEELPLRQLRQHHQVSLETTRSLKATRAAEAISPSH